MAGVGGRGKMVGTGHTRERDVEIWVERPVEGKRGQKSVLGMTDDARKSCAPLSDLAGMGRGAEGLFEVGWRDDGGGKRTDGERDLLAEW